MEINKLFDEREKYSQKKIDALQSTLKEAPELKIIPKLTIFAAGSYARLEASEYSDIDLFFLNCEDPKEMLEPKTCKIKLFAKVLNTIESMQFPKFTNDGEYLELLHMADMINNLGGRYDDSENHFTTRMLLLLESKYVYGETYYKEAVSNIIASYFKDYPRHKDDFRPVFLYNDIMRYWKTLCLNYENKRHQTEKPGLIKNKVRNFKLKFSRMTTCFATIAALTSIDIKEENVVDLVQRTPRQRLQLIPEIFPKTNEIVQQMLNEYCWFLEMTGLSTNDIETYFDDNEKRKEAFNRANAYSDLMYKMLCEVNIDKGIFRYLVI